MQCGSLAPRIEILWSANRSISEEFWRRVEARDLEPAERTDRLKLPEYFAMEAFVVEA